MKKNLFLIITILVLTNFSILAQRGKRQGEAKTSEQRAEKVTNKLAEKLSLTADQKNQIYDINLEAAKKNDDLKAKVKSGELQRGNGAIMKERKTIEQDRDTRITALLDDTQKVKYEELKAEKKAKIQERRKKRKGLNNSNE